MSQCRQVPRNNLTNSQKRELFKKYSNGVPTKNLVAEFGFSWPTLKTELLRAGVEPDMPMSDEEIDFILKEGPYAPAPPPNPFGDSKELAIIGETMTEKVNEVLRVVKTATTVEGVVNGLTATLTLRQLMEAIQNPPPLEDWDDIAKAVKILRETFGMHIRKNDASVKGIDYAMVNARPAKGAVLDI